MLLDLVSLMSFNLNMMVSSRSLNESLTAQVGVSFFE